MSEQFKIGDDVFLVTPLPGERSFVLQVKLYPALVEFMQLFKLFNRVVKSAKSIEGETEGAEANEENEADASAAIEAAAFEALEEASSIVARICDKLPPETLQHIMRELLCGATMNGVALYGAPGKANPIDVLLRGKAITTWRLLAKAVEVSYPDFFGVLRGFAARAPGGPSEKSSTSKSSGPAGESS